MNKLIGSILVFCLVIVTIEAWKTPDQLDNDPVKAEAQIKQSWQRFKTEFKPHPTTLDGVTDKLEEAKRYGTFKLNYRNIVAHNAKYARGEVTYKMGINRFADWNQEEMSKMRSKKMPIEKSAASSSSSDVEVKATVLPASVDWRTQGAVTPVKDQGQCGSCYAFATIAALESAYFLKKGKLVSLSEQEIVDCATDWNYILGCYGGYPDAVYTFLQPKGSVATEESYPYLQYENPQCKLNNTMATLSFNMTKHVALFGSNETTLQQLVATVGPVVATLDVDYPGFSAYAGGIYDHQTCDNAYSNHAITVIGYGTDTKTKLDFWLIKNSWGTWWGEGGYLRMRRNSNNQCAIASQIYYPVLA